MICFDCGDPATTAMKRVEAGYCVVERELCARCTRSRGVTVEAEPAPPTPALLGHDGVPWLVAPARVAPPLPPAPRLWVRTDATGQLWIRVSDEDQADGWAPPAPVYR